MDPPHIMTAFVAATTPVVLRIMPLLGSPAPIGYIYDPTPARDGDGGLLAVASAFFSHQGHQVFLDPCSDLVAYRRAGVFAEPIIDVDRLPDHVLSAGLDLLESSPASLAVDSLGMSFMVAYLLAPAPFVPHGLVSLSPMRGDTTGQPFSAFSSSSSGGSKAGGRSRSFRHASPSSRSVTLSTHLTPSLGNAHRRPDPDPCEVFTRAPSYGSGRAPFYSSPCRVPSSVGYGGHPGGQDAGSVVSSSSSYRRTPHLDGGSNSSDIDTDRWGFFVFLRTYSSSRGGLELLGHQHKYLG
jgi:hypothetical protein